MILTGIGAWLVVIATALLAACIGGLLAAWAVTGYLAQKIGSYDTEEAKAPHPN